VPTQQHPRITDTLEQPGPYDRIYGSFVPDDVLLTYLQTYSNQFKYEIIIIPTKAHDLPPIITFITNCSIQYITPLNSLGHFEFKQLFPP